MDTIDAGIKKVNLIFPDYTLSEKIIPFPFDSRTFAVMILIFCGFSPFVPGCINSKHNSILYSIYYCAF